MKYLIKFRLFPFSFVFLKHLSIYAFLFLTFSFCLLISTLAWAMDFHVTTLSEFQAALTTAVSNSADDTILMASGTYYGNFQYIGQEANALTIKAEESAEPGSVILDGQQLGYVLLMDGAGLDVNFVLEGLTIRNGNSLENGGGIYAKQTGNKGTFTVIDCIIKNNKAASYGGGAYFTYFNAVILDGSNISNNSGGNDRGGVYCNYGGTLTFTNSTISNNSGNGITLYRTISAIFTNNTISDNSNYGIYCELYSYLENGIVTIYPGNGTFTNNKISNNKYGVSCNGPGTYTNNTISNNVYYGVSCNGPGTYTNNTISYNKWGVACGSGTFTNNTISNNSDRGVQCSPPSIFINNIITNNIGNGIQCSSVYSGNVKLIFTNNTIALNTGNGVYINITSISLTNIYNNIIWGNGTSGTGSDVYLTAYGADSYFYNNIYSSASAIWFHEGDNIILDPMFYDFTNGDFHVTAGSPAINGGLNTAPNLAETDLDGNSRILDSIVDIGAYERSTVALHPADINGDWIISQTEFDNYNASWRANTEWANEPNPIPMNYLTRAGYLLKKDVGKGYANIGVGKPGTWVPNN